MRHQFVRSLAGSRDPNFKNVTLLLHGDGTNGGQNNTFLDSGPNNLTITRNGSVPQGSFSPYGDRWSNYFDGTGDYLVTAANTAFQLGTGDFSVDLWFYQTGSTASIGTRAIFGIGNNGQTGDIQLFNWWPFGGNPANTLALNSSAGGTLVVTNTAYIPDTWNHVAISRASGVVSIYLNGVRVANASFTTNASYNILTIGRPYTNLSQEHWLGYISNFRLVKGVALYSGTNINVPTSPLSAIANTSILTCQSNRFLDASSNNFTVTRNGDVSVQRFSPFSPDAEYRTDRIAGSAYFSGANGNSLSVSSATANIDTNPFTVESWVYYLGSNNQAWFTPSPGLPWTVIGTTLRVYNATGFLSAGPIERNTWTHIAVTRDFSNVLRVFVNGVLNSSVTTTTAFNSTTPIIGERFGNGTPFAGYIAGFRMLIHTALYTSNFTPPTSPPAVINDTRWLVNFTNASIRDNAMMSALETVGNAQISTSVKKYGTGSLYFSGTTNLATNGYVKAGIGQLANLSSGDFTVECWFYGMNNSLTDTESSLFQQGEHDWRLMYRRLSGQLVLRYAVASVEQISTAGNLFSLNTWNHVAVCRSGTTTTLYLNGVSVGTTTASPANSTNFVYVGANLVGTSVYWPLNGYIDDFRLTKGIARYTSNFTPPTAPFPDF